MSIHRTLTAMVLLIAALPVLAAQPPAAGIAKVDPSVAELREQVHQLTDELQRLRASVAILEEALRDAGIRMRPKTNSFTHEELLEQAQQCKAAWDMPNLDGTTRLGEEAAKKLAISERER